MNSVQCVDVPAYEKFASAARWIEFTEERDRLIWLEGRGVACPEVLGWREEQEGTSLVVTAIPVMPAADLSGSDLLNAWPSITVRLEQESTELTVCHDDPCMPNLVGNSKTLQCTGLIDLGRIEKADRYAGLTLMIANAENNWTSSDKAKRAFDTFFASFGGRRS